MIVIILRKLILIITLILNLSRLNRKGTLPPPPPPGLKAG